MILQYVKRSYFVSIGAGAVTQQRSGFSLASFLESLKRFLELIIVFFKTLFDPNAATNLTDRQQRRERASGYKVGGPGSGAVRRGPRITGLSDLRDAGGSTSPCIARLEF